MSGLEPSPHHCSRAGLARTALGGRVRDGTMRGSVPATRCRGWATMKGRLAPVNPYVLTALAMCGIMLIALVGTAYLAVYFNRRGKADLLAALEPLAESIDGTVNLEHAEVSGKRASWPVYGRMANASEGPGRVFQVDVVDAAGGEDWQYTSTPPRKERPRSVDFTGPEELREVLEPLIDDGFEGIIDPERERFRIDYSTAKGTVQLIRAMQTRRDIPTAPTFSREVDVLTDIAAANRSFVETRESEVTR